MNKHRIAFTWVSGGATYSGTPFEKATKEEVEMHAERLSRMLDEEQKRTRSLERRIRAYQAALAAVGAEEDVLP